VKIELGNRCTVVDQTGIYFKGTDSNGVDYVTAALVGTDLASIQMPQHAHAVGRVVGRGRESGEPVAVARLKHEVVVRDRRARERRDRRQRVGVEAHRPEPTMQAVRPIAQWIEQRFERRRDDGPRGATASALIRVNPVRAVSKCPDARGEFSCELA